MRVAVVETAPRGGLLHYAVQLADALARRGHEVDLIVPAGNELEGRSGEARMLAALVAPVGDSAEPSSRLAYLRRRIGIGLRLARSLWRVLRLSDGRRYDAEIVNAEASLTPVAAALLALAVRPRRPLLGFVCHNVRPFNRWAGTELYRSSRPLTWLLRRAYARLDVVFVHGERSRGDFSSLWPARRLVAIPHGDETLLGAEPPPPSREPRALFFGDWRKVKGLEVLMQAFDRLSGRLPEARLTIAGTPSPVDLDPDVVRAWARRYGERVTVVDRYVPIEDVPGTFAAARAVATPYLAGYQSGVVHLAMTMGRAVVASDVGDLPSAVRDGETGVIVPRGDPDALAGALERLLREGEPAARMGAAGRRRVVSASSWDVVAERVESALEAER